MAFDQIEVAVGRIRKDPGHRLERVEGAGGLHRIDDAAHALYDQIEGGPAEVVGVRAVPAIRTARSGDVHRADRAESLGERERGNALGLRCLAFGLVHADRIRPGADFGDDDVALLGCLAVAVHRRVIGVERARRVRGSVAGVAHQGGPCLWIAHVAKYRAS